MPGAPRIIADTDIYTALTGAGSSNQVLTSNGPGNPPSFKDNPAGVTVSGLTTLLLTLPTTFPSTPGVLWLNGGVLSIS